MVAIFDPSKPESRKRFVSEEVRGNFQALSRANDLRCIEQDPPDLTIRVEAGAYAITSERTLHFAGGDSDPIDTITGGSATQQRIVVLELDDVGLLQFNYNGSWVTPPVLPVAPDYNSNRVPLCEILVTYGDSSIIQDNITDVRPMINLGAGTQLIDPGRVYEPSASSVDIDTSAHFTYFVGNDELLVWRETAPASGIMSYQISGVNYTELNDHTVRFSVPFAGGEKVVIWKAGLSATPGHFGLADLSNVDGNQEAAFMAADVPTAINPFLTVSGHNTINHLTDVPSLAPVATHLVTTATNPAMRHHASEIEASLLTVPRFTNATNVQGVLDDLNDNFYQIFLAQHLNTGIHGPNVTITTTAGVNPSLQIVNAVTEGIRVIQTNAGAMGIRVFQYSNNNAISIEKTNTGNATCLQVFNSGSGYGIDIEQVGDQAGLLVNKSTGNVNTVGIVNGGTGAGLAITQNGNGIGLSVTKTNTGSIDCVNIYNQGSGAALRVTQSSTVVPSPAILVVDNSGTLGRAIVVDQRSNDITLYLNKIGTGVGNVIEINNAGSGYDVRGHNNNWNIDKNGNALFQSVMAKVSNVEYIASPAAITGVYSDVINTTINVTSVTTKILITLNITLSGGSGGPVGTDYGLDLELRTAAAGGGGIITTRVPVWVINPAGVGMNQFILPLQFATRITPGAAGVYNVYARFRTNAGYPSVPTLSDVLLTLQVV